MEGALIMKCLSDGRECNCGSGSCYSIFVHWFCVDVAIVRDILACSRYRWSIKKFYRQPRFQFLFIKACEKSLSK